MRSLQRTWRRRAVAGAATALLLTGVGGALAPAMAGAATPTCQPGSGAHLAGKHVKERAITKHGGLQCADLRNADLTGVDLIQVDLSGALATGANFSNVDLSQADLSAAKLGGANLSGADLTQVTLTGADLSNANLSNAKLIQAEAGDTTWTDADLSNADLSQATLTNATFVGAKVDGADFTQADLGGTDFDSARGLTPWSLYVLIAAGAIFLLLAGFSFRKAYKRRGRSSAATQPEPAPNDPAVVDGNYVGEPYQSIWTRPASSTVQLAPAASPAATGAFHPINPPASATRGFGATLLIGLLGSLIVAFGVHLFLGGMVGAFSFAFDTLATSTCSAPQCAVGVGSGTVGLVCGVFVALAGFFVRSRA